MGVGEGVVSWAVCTDIVFGEVVWYSTCLGGRRTWLRTTFGRATLLLLTWTAPVLGVGVAEALLLLPLREPMLLPPKLTARGAAAASFEDSGFFCRLVTLVCRRRRKKV